MKDTGKSRALWAAFLAVVAICQLLPFYFALTTSFKRQNDLSSVFLFPFSGLTWDNFGKAITDGSILLAIRNSLVVTVVSTVIVMMVAAMASYPLARRATRLNKVVEFLILAVMMVPPLSILVPLYTQLSRMGLLNTWYGLSIVMICIQLPQAIFLYTNFLRAIPISMEEAATVDGASRWQTFTRVVLPMMQPVTISVVILCATNVWNEFALSSYIMNRAETRTIAPAIASFFGTQGSDVNAAVAGSLMSLLPILVAYLFLQKYFMKGMLAGADKG